jgi:Ca2+-binding EF-hand superfamily protein
MNDLTVESLALRRAVNNTSSEIPEIEKEEKCEQMKVIAGIELAEETIDEIKEAFLEFDIDSDGTITTQVMLRKYQGGNSICYSTRFICIISQPDPPK